MTRSGDLYCAPLQSLAPKVTGMLLELAPTQVMTMLSSQDLLQQRVDEAVDLLMAQGRSVGWRERGGEGDKQCRYLRCLFRVLFTGCIE